MKIIRNQITIRDITENLNTRVYRFPRWQREERKENPDYCEFRNELVNTVLEGIDIPKIYLYHDKKRGKYDIIDGGHRIRTLCKFMTGCTTAKVNRKYFYYRHHCSHSNPSRLKKLRNATHYFDETMKGIFDNYKLDVIIYEEISENKARTIFNRLNQCKPLTVSECINSYLSPFVDMLIRVAEMRLDFDNRGEMTIMELYKDITVSRKIDHHEYLTDFVALFSVLHFTREEYAKNGYYEAGKKSLKFVKDEIGADIIVSEVDDEFIKSLERLFEAITYVQQELPVMLKWKPRMGEIMGFHMVINDLHKTSDVSEIMKKISPYIIKSLIFNDRNTEQKKTEALMLSMAVDGNIEYDDISNNIIKYNEELLIDLKNDHLIRSWGETNQKNKAPILISSYLEKVIKDKKLQDKYSNHLKSDTR